MGVISRPTIVCSVLCWYCVTRGVSSHLVVSSTERAALRTVPHFPNHPWHRSPSNYNPQTASNPHLAMQKTTVSVTRPAPRGSPWFPRGKAPHTGSVGKMHERKMMHRGGRSPWTAPYVEKQIQCCDRTAQMVCLQDPAGTLSTHSSWIAENHFLWIWWRGNWRSRNSLLADELFTQLWELSGWRIIQVTQACCCNKKNQDGNCMHFKCRGILILSAVTPTWLLGEGAINSFPFQLHLVWASVIDSFYLWMASPSPHNRQSAIVWKEEQKRLEIGRWKRIEREFLHGEAGVLRWGMVGGVIGKPFQCQAHLRFSDAASLGNSTWRSYCIDVSFQSE